MLSRKLRATAKTKNKAKRKILGIFNQASEDQLQYVLVTGHRPNCHLITGIHYTTVRTPSSENTKLYKPNTYISIALFPPQKTKLIT